MCNSLFEKLITFQNRKRMNLKKYVIAYKRSLGDNLHRFSPHLIFNNLIFSYAVLDINPSNTKHRQLYLKTQFVPRSKHFSSRL